MATAKLFRNGRSQAVRLPKEFRFEGEEVSIRREGKRVILEDLGSKNGTRLNGERVRGTRELRDGDAVRLGDVQLLFRCLAFDESTATERRPVGGR
jgi:virulence-associated protein VagC